MALIVLDLTSELVDLSHSDSGITTTTLVREITGVDLSLATPHPPKTKNKFECCVCYERRQEKSRSMIVCGHDLCLKCEKKMIKKSMYDCPICRSKDAVFNAFISKC